MTHFTTKLRAVVQGLTMIMAFSNGCTRVITFKTVDAFSGEPIRGVDVWLVHGRKDIILSNYSKRDHVGVTDLTGLVSVGPMKWGEFNQIYFHHTGRFRATAVWPAQHGGVEVYTQAVDPVAANGKRSVLEPSAGQVEVPMFLDTLPRIKIVVPGITTTNVEKWCGGNK